MYLKCAQWEWRCRWTAAAALRTTADEGSCTAAGRWHKPGRYHSTNIPASWSVHNCDNEKNIGLLEFHLKLAHYMYSIGKSSESRTMTGRRIMALILTWCLAILLTFGISQADDQVRTHERSGKSTRTIRWEHTNNQIRAHERSGESTRTTR